MGLEAPAQNSAARAPLLILARGVLGHIWIDWRVIWANTQVRCKAALPKR